MTKVLESITLSNIRRFAENVKIDIGPGVTVVLAPNGSGKTALFEALELALTCGVQRVGDRLENLIREGNEAASVKLNFGSWSREVLLKKTICEIVDPGKMNEIFGDVETADIPYLLRLTHLLDQRDRSWFCHQESSADAGKQLSMLPAGKDAVQISSAIAKAKTALSRALTEVQGKIVQKNQERDEWAKALLRRDIAMGDLDLPLIPISRLTKDLAGISDPKSELEFKTIGALRDHWNRTKTLISQRKQELENLINSLRNFSSYPEKYVQLTHERQSLSDKLRTLQENRHDNDKLFDSLKIEVLAKGETRKSIMSELARLKLSEELRRLYQTDYAAKQQAEQDNEKAKEDELNSLALLLPIKEELAQARENQLSYNALEEMELSLRLRIDELRAGTLALEQWEELNGKVLHLNSVLAGHLTQLSQEDELIKHAAAARESQEKSVRNIRAIFDSLSDASDVLKSSVALIIKNLPSDASSCPVCLTEHGVEALRTRIERSVKEIDPRIAECADVLRLENEKLLLLAQKERDFIADWTRSNKRRHETIGIVQQLGAQIDAARTHVLLYECDLVQARDRIKDVSGQLELESAKIRGLRDAAGTRITPSAFSEISQRFASADAIFDSAVQHRAQSERRLEQIKQNLDAAKYDAVKNIDLSEFQRDISVLENRVEDINLELGEIEQRRVDTHLKLLSLDDDIARLRNRNGGINAELSKMDGEWIASGIGGIPSYANFTARYSRLEAQIIRTDADLHLIKEIEQEVARHENASLSNEAQRRVDDLRCEIPEEKFSESLEEGLRELVKGCERIVERRATLETFGLHLANGMANVRDQISSVAPFWQAILRRIIQEPRFAGANLNYFTKWNRSHASVEVKLGNKTASISDVASQAQMTDLQLSFMFAMALANKWSPWKALLLDDPTQHHDLVHASSVFDVIRDLVSDHKFQVLLTTHDALQARFLMRKLRNDGIPARLWTLEATVDGMVGKKIAEHIQEAEHVEAT